MNVFQSFRNWLVLITGLALGLSGCDQTRSPAPLRVATYLDAQGRERVESVYRYDKPGNPPISWIILGPDDPIAPWLAPRSKVDILLAGPSEEHERLRHSGQTIADDPAQEIVLEIDLADRSTTWLDGKSRGLDPRISSHVLIEQSHTLSQDPYIDNFTFIVGLSTLSPAMNMLRIPERGPYTEGISLLANGGQRASSRALIQALIAAKLAARRPRRSGFQPGDELLADLLGASMIDSRDELLTAYHTSPKAQTPRKVYPRVGEPPPWPPASVSKMLARADGPALLDTLLDQILPETKGRNWLISQWTAGAPVPIDRRILNEIATVDDGALLVEPRFRAWLRSEWTAWARQHYRRVARVASGEWTEPSVLKRSRLEPTNP